MPKKVLVVGLGGVGVIAAYTLQLNADCEVSAVIKSDYEHVKSNGYELDSCDYGKIDSWRPNHYVKSVKEAVEFGPYDYVVVVVKNIPDVYNVEDIYADAVTKDTVIVLLENGLGIEKPVFKRFPGNIVLSGVSMISSANYSGKVHQNGPDFLTVGYFDNGVVSKELQQEKVDEFVKLYSTPQNKCIVDPDVKFTRWRKLLYNATFNTVCALVNLDVGRVTMFGGIETLIEPAMDEIIAIAKSDGVTLDPSLKHGMIHSDDGHYYAPSMLVDVRKGNQIELQVILGNALDIARENAVAAPILSIIYELLKLVQMRLKEQSGKIVLPKERPL
ncbi:unnamed protein product [Cyberlindnera jadinii]|uniref:2-dehydropantoate 2-reductase n=1 Tax=Cyberlindnera jadinii (strain ATCC 18201 / CBS 1600 / BCRC 20928 / JCM 3617 / NBRC 0987 / NRRL Y-1542) TaxID=983966 RepID=A0A0H5C2V6_CYBJN|nr:ApbA-domain-containing protein [Cyberlindnera jadinii NRRL Y-1542]ODV75107.1 ApbA-domain-containing protein [Cyberlindnera jadinii NRRL Y-1542]CEP22295.1 unnamed protein product [Cyberlindnera jadinii]